MYLIMKYVTARRYRQRTLSALRKKATEARRHADSCVEDGENENAVSHEVLDAYANGLEEACRIICGVSVSNE